MTEEQWKAAWELFQSAHSVAPEQIHVFLHNATGDLKVRDAVLTMLDGNPKPESSVETLDRIGQRIGRYVLTERLGEGGMGEVYAARDSELSRSVAVKLLASAASGTSSVLRFIREAKAASALNHPNIVTIYEVIHVTSRLAIVMELVGGTSLRQLCGSPLPVDQVLHIGEQIARALAAAHAQGIIHCDIKPENLMVRPDGFVKVLDFGLARDLSSVASTSVLPAGTLRYMSPEQSQGEPAAPASDVFSLGIVLYELAAGVHPFESVSIFEMLKALNRSQPSPPSALNPFVPAHLDALILRMLAQDPGGRPTASEASKLLETRFASQPALAPVRPTMLRVKKTNNVPRWVAVAVLGGALVLGLIWWWSSRSSNRPLIRFDVDQGMAALSGRSRLAVSPDGARLAYLMRNPAGASVLAMRLLDQSQPTVFPGTESAYDPFFSPDGLWVGFFAGQNLKKISVRGGAPVNLCTAEAVERGAAWGKDGFIIANLDNSHLFRIPEGGGKPERLQAIPEDHGERTWRWPQILPGGGRVLFTGSRGSGAGSGFDEANIEVLSLDTGKVTVVQRGGYFGRYLPTGHLVYVHQGTLFALRFDLKELKTRGDPVPILDDVAGDPVLGAGMLDFSTAPDRPGILAYRSGNIGEGPKTLAWMDTTGKTETLSIGLAAMTPSISPDGKLVAFSMGGNILLRNLDRGTGITLTQTGLVNNSPLWLPDGKHLIFDQDGGDESVIWWVRADGSGEPRKLLASVDGLRVRSISPDGRHIAYARQNAVTGWDIWILPLDPSDPELPVAGKPALFAGEAYDQFDPVFSPDGHWIAYVASTANFTNQVYASPFPGDSSGPKWQVSAEGGLFPVWSRDGEELLFLGPDGRVMQVRYTVNGTHFSAGKPQVWSPSPIIRVKGLHWDFDVSPDGKRILTFPAPPSAPDQKPSLHVTVLLNFFDELRRRVP